MWWSTQNEAGNTTSRWAPLTNSVLNKPDISAEHTRPGESRSRPAKQAASPPPWCHAATDASEEATGGTTSNDAILTNPCVTMKEEICSSPSGRIIDSEAAERPSSRA
jgi:hypothetical protein